MDSNPHDRRIAIHEAGHAVAALLYGRSWGCAILEPGGAALGVAGVGDLSEPSDTSPAALASQYRPTDAARLLVEESILSVAGRVAELLDTHAAFIGPLPSGGDRRHAEAACSALLQGVSDDACEAAFSAFTMAAARRLLGPHLTAIRAVADALQVRRRLSAAEVADIFQTSKRGEPK